jgi:ribosomal protein S4
VDSFLSVLEHRLDMFLYRSNFSKSIFHSRHLILHNKVLVNFKTVSFCSYQLSEFDVVTLQNNIRLYMKNQLKKKLLFKFLLSYFPRYLMVSYKLMCGFFIKKPTINSIPFPFKINLNRWLGLAKMEV